MTRADPQGEVIIDGRFVVSTTQPLPAMGGIDAFRATDRNGGGPFVALRVAGAIPARNRLAAFRSVAAGLVTPLAHVTQAGWRWFIVEQPSCPLIFEAARHAAAEHRPWGENQIIQLLLRPVAATLLALHAQGVTHRAIRPDNVFGSAEQGAVLGPCWAMAPAMMQDARWEPPWVGACAPEARGEGSSADDVYALGVLALSLHLGREPMAGMTVAAVIERKLEVGSYAALVGEERLASGLADLLRTMLADDPEQRPTLSSLAELTLGRERRGMRRVAARAQRAIAVGPVSAWNARMLAWAIGRDHREGVRLLRTGAVSQWLRRAAESPVLATRLDEYLAGAAADSGGRDGVEAMLAMRAVTILDPGAALLWEGSWLWPDAVGAMLWCAAAASGDSMQGMDMLGGRGVIESLRRAVRADVFARWGAALARHASRSDPGGWLQACRTWRDDAGPDPMLRLLYVLNPELPCLSSKLRSLEVRVPEDLVAAIEAALGDGRLAAPSDAAWGDTHLDAFIAARDDASTARHDMDLARKLPDIVDLVRFAGLQSRGRRAACPNLAESLMPAMRRAIERRPGKSRRRALGERVGERAHAGDLAGMLALLSDARSLEADMQAQSAALARLAQLKAHREQLRDGRQHIGARARRLAGEIGVGAGLLLVAGLGFVEILD